LLFTNRENDNINEWRALVDGTIARGLPRVVMSGDGIACEDDHLSRDCREGTRWMPWRWRPKKDVATRRNASGSRGQAVIRGNPNGATRRG